MKAQELLVLSPWWPFPADNGARLRAFHLLRELARQGYAIRLIAGVQEDAEETVRGGVPRELSELCRSVTPVSWFWHTPERMSKGGAIRALFSNTPRSIAETPNPRLMTAIQEALACPTDVVLGMQLGIDAYIPELPSHLPLILDEVELSPAERAYCLATGTVNRLRTGMTYAKSVRYWCRRLQRYHLLTSVSEEEAAAVRQVVGPGMPISVIPNGVDTAAFIPSTDHDRVPGQLLYNGALTYAPNRDAVTWFMTRILPKITEKLPGVHLKVTGRYTQDVAPLAQMAQLHLTGYLPEMGEILAASQAAVVPLRSGGGTRLKILEAFAAGLPVVSTSIGAAGLQVESGAHLLLADEENEFSAAVVKILTDPHLASTLSRNARRLVEAQYDWSVIVARLSEDIEATAVRIAKR